MCRGSGNLQVKQMVGMLYEIAIDKEYKTQRGLLKSRGNSTQVLYSVVWTIVIPH